MQKTMPRMVALCKKCGNEEVHTTRPNGRPASRCMACQRTYSRQHYDKNRTSHNKRRYQRTSERRSEIRAWLTDLKRVPCADCGGDFPPVCMDFDHVSGVKRFNISIGMVNHTWDEIRVEVAKCEVVCANCHRIRTAERGDWAGQE